jgi:Ca2+-binding RTX toxin-like protein
MAIFNGNAFRNRFVGTAQDDEFYMNAGDDTAYGQGGDDYIVGGWGDDSLHGGNDDDDIFGGHGKDMLFGDAGNDDLEGDHDDDLLHGGSGQDRLDGGAGDDRLFGDEGDDVFTSAVGADFMDGGDGIDEVSYAFATTAVTVNLTTGNGTGVDAEGDSFTNIENITGSNLADTLVGDGGDNLLQGRGGADRLDGAGGVDTAYYFPSSVGVNVSLVTGTGSGGEAAGDLLFNIENITGSSHDDVLTGDSGANELRGSQGDDLLVGGLGADTLDGGDDTDTANYALSASFVFVNLFTGTGSTGDAAGDTLIDIETVIGSAFGDFLFGDASANALHGGLGRDTLQGRGGADTLDGGADIDAADYLFSAAAVTVNLATGTGSGGDAAGDTFISIENLLGSDFADLLTGNAGSNFLDGRTGADTLRGGGGDDTYLVDNAGDVVQEDAGQGFDSVSTFINLTLGANVEGLVLAGAATTGTGNAEGNTLIGSELANILDGAGGADLIDGRAGADIMNGGEGIDTLAYERSSAAVLINLGNGQASGGDAQGDTFTGFENLLGSRFADALFGDGLANTINGGIGADSLFGGFNDDTFAFFIGQANGDTVIDFEGNGAAAGDQLRFTGYGAGTLVQIDATHWQVSNQAGTLQEIITFSNAALVDPGDILFV